MDHYPKSAEAPADLSYLLNNRTPVELPPHANGTGFQYAFHSVDNLVLPPFLVHEEAGTPTQTKSRSRLLQ